MPLETPARIVGKLTSRGYNAEREAVTLIANATDPDAVLERAIEHVPDDALKITTEHVRAAGPESAERGSSADRDPSVSTGMTAETVEEGTETPVETKGVSDGASSAKSPTSRNPEGAVQKKAPKEESTRTDHDSSVQGQADFVRKVASEKRAVEIGHDVTGESTGTGEYGDFVAVFRDRYKRLSKLLRGRVNHRPADAVASMAGGSDAALIGLVNDIRSTASGHWLIEIEDASGAFPALVMKDRQFASVVDELLLDEVIAVEGTLADDSGILFADSIHFPDVPRTYQPSYADRHVQAALISDVHVGSQEFMESAWNRFADWLHTEAAEHVEYLLIAGDMVEGVGVYPNQDHELTIIDIYEQYEAFAEHLKSVPGDLDIVMIPGNHDAVRLAEPQPAFDEELRDIMSAHDSQIVSNPATVTVEGVDVLMYHGVSLDEVIAELPEDKASYDDPEKAMYQLLKKRHVAPQFGGRNRLAPEKEDYLVIDTVPDIFHTGHVHKLGWGKYHNVMAINSGCWQAQTDFQKSVNIDPDAGFAPVVDLDTLNLTVHDFN